MNIPLFDVYFVAETEAIGVTIQPLLSDVMKDSGGAYPPEELSLVLVAVAQGLSGNDPIKARDVLQRAIDDGIAAVTKVEETAGH